MANRIIVDFTPLTQASEDSSGNPVSALLGFQKYQLQISYIGSSTPNATINGAVYLTANTSNIIDITDILQSYAVAPKLRSIGSTFPPGLSQSLPNQKVNWSIIINNTTFQSGLFQYTRQTDYTLPIPQQMNIPIGTILNKGFYFPVSWNDATQPMVYYFGGVATNPPNSGTSYPFQWQYNRYISDLSSMPAYSLNQIPYHQDCKYPVQYLYINKYGGIDFIACDIVQTWTKEVEKYTGLFNQNITDAVYRTSENVTYTIITEPIPYQNELLVPNFLNSPTAWLNIEGDLSTGTIEVNNITSSIQRVKYQVEGVIQYRFEVSSSINNSKLQL